MLMLLFLIIPTISYACSDVKDEPLPIHVKTRSSLYCAIRNHDHVGVNILLSWPCTDCNMQDAYGDTPLHWAIREHNQYAFDLLIKKNSDPSIPNDNKQTPLQFAYRIRDYQLANNLSTSVTNIMIGTLEPIQKQRELIEKQRLFYMNSRN